MKLLRLFVAFVVLGWGSANAQRNFGFVSPNTRDDLKLEDAIQGMNSQEELSLLSHARSLGCVISRTVTTRPAVGSWSDGAEHSILIRVDADESTIRYLMSRLGRDANQKAVVYFHPRVGGPARLYVVNHIRAFNFRQIGSILDRSGIVFRTLVPGRHGTTAYIIDTENTLGSKVLRASRKLHQQVISQRGNASFIGDDSSRDKGQALFAAEIKQYEVKHPKLPPPCEVK